MNSDEQFEAIVHEHHEPLFRFAFSLTRRETDAWDLTQHTFYVWATKGHQLRDATKAKTWLFTTLHRKFLESQRRQTRFAHYELDQVSEQLPVSSPEAVNKADASEVLSALSQVDETFRAAVALYYLEDYPYKEIAAILDVPLGTVKSRIARGIAQLREILLSGDAEFLGNKTAPPKQSEQSPEQSLADEPAGQCFDEWDFSSTQLGELFRCS
jgi:RNA polymerase sigma-70 factor, ECF subfamily